MKSQASFAIIFIVLIALSACRKDETKSNHLVGHAASYLPLQPGNYWIYRHVWKDTTGTEIIADGVTYDSFFVEKDTMINTNTYAKFWQIDQVGHPLLSLMRDSSRCLVDPSGKVYLSPQNASSILQDYYFITYGTGNYPDTIARVTIQMDGNGVSVNVPAGTFTTARAKQTYQFAPYQITPQDTRSYHTCYADSIGIVSREMVGYIATDIYSDQQLVRYHVQR